MNNLIIGSTSQLSNYFPSNYKRISSRDIDINSIINGGYENVYILFSEQRTFLNENDDFFLKINFYYTLNLIDRIKNYVKRIIIYSTSELWNNYEGEVSLNLKFNYNYTPYIKSKEILCNHINDNKKNYQNIHIIYPFNFNSIYRKQGYLFYKIFDSLINKNINYVGDLNFSRDIIHPSIIVKESINTNQDIIVGSGELINIKDFVNDLFQLHNINSNDYIKLNNENNLPNQRKNYLSKIKYSNYKELLNLTYSDVKKINITSDK
jgi:nucleoside-diphosphate-sugar epimerase